MNPLTLARLISNVAIVVVVGAFLLTVAFNTGDLILPWFWIIGGTALFGAVLQLAVSILRPSAIPTAIDEQVRATEVGSQSFGYWISLAIFLAFLVLVLQERMSAPLAFFLMGAPLGAAPALYMLIAHFRGRAG